MLTIEKLIEYGADVKAAMEICMNNEEFYLRMVNLMLQEKQVETLQQAVAEGNLDAAFEAAHALKGVAGNLSLTPLYETASEMTELLRKEQDADYQAYLSQILKIRDDLLALK